MQSPLLQGTDSAMKNGLLEVGHDHDHDHQEGGGCCEHGGHAEHDNGHGHGHGHGHGSAQDGSYRAPLVPSSVLGTVAQSMEWLNAHDRVECGDVSHEAIDVELGCCDHSQLNTTCNVLVTVRANELSAMASVNTFLALISVLYIVVNLVCTLLNSYDNDCDPSKAGCSPATTPLTFHSLEFGATFIFNTIDVLALSYAPRTLSNQYQSPSFLKLVVLFNVCISGVSFLLVLINLGKFEVLSHELEYCNELTIAIFDAVILISLVHRRSHESRFSCGQRCVSCLALAAAGCVATVQLGVYNLSGWTAGGDSLGEQNAHYLEFVFGIASAGITFWFTMDNKICAERRLREIMYGNLQSALK